MNEIAQIVENRLDQMGLSPIAAAEQAGLKRDTFRSVLRGQQPTYHRLKEICQALGLDFHIGLPDLEDSAGIQKITYIGKVAAGGGEHPNHARIFIADDGQSINAPPIIDETQAKRFGGLYAATVEGDSMNPTYTDGDLVMFYPNDPQSRNLERLIGKDCVVLLEDGTTVLKRLRRGDKYGTFNLESINPHWGVMINQHVIKANPIRYVKRQI